MGKIYPVSTKYLITAEITANGSLNKSDIVGAIFGQTEGLLGDELELRELQKSGRIGRIEVEVEVKDNITKGVIKVPSSLSKAETAIIAAALETIDRIGPCDSTIKVKDIEDVRLNKRELIMKRAKSLLKKMSIESTDATEITDEIKKSVRASKIIEYGPDKLTASSDIESAEEVIIVEGRADVVNLLKHGFTGIIAINGVKVPKSIKKILNSKVCTLFIDGDRGGEMIFNKVSSLGDLDYVAVAPDGKEVEELTGKEIHKCLRARMKPDEFMAKLRHGSKKRRTTKKTVSKRSESAEIKKFRELLSDLFGTRGAYLLDKDMNILGKVPSSELENALDEIKDVDTIVIDGVVGKDTINIAADKGVKRLVANKFESKSRRINLIEL